MQEVMCKRLRKWHLAVLGFPRWVFGDARAQRKNGRFGHSNRGKGHQKQEAQNNHHRVDFIVWRGGCSIPKEASHF